MGLPMGISSLGYLTTALVAIYVRNVTLKMTLLTDWFTFVLAIFFSNLTYLILINNFSEINIHYSNLFYNSLFTFLFFPVFWFLFNSYQFITNLGKDD